MAGTFWRLRPDLEIRAESPAAGSGVIVKDPVSRRFYRFTHVQASVLELMNGQRDLASIAAIASEKHSTEVTEQQLTDFVQKLMALLLLDHPSCWSKLENSRKVRRRLMHNLLSIKVRAFNPDNLLAGLEKKFRFCFGTAFSVISWIIIGVAVYISLHNWEQLFFSFGTLFSLYSIPLIIIAAFAVMTVHEFSHAVTLKHFGGKVEEMGFLILYFIPAFYCNVSDAWLLKKRERLRVTLAGGYIQIIIWAVATIAWRLLSTETLLSRICLITIAFSGIQTLFNINPLIRLDGYYLLSDYVEIPNLRTKAFAYLKNKFKTLLTGRTRDSAGGQTPREKRILLCYGVSASLFTAALIWIMFQRLGSWMVREYQVWGAVFITVLFFMAVPIAGKEHEKPSPKSHSPIPARVKKYVKILIVFWILVIVCLLPWELKISGDFSIMPQRKVLVTPLVEGNLKSINVDQGSHVNKGDVLAEIENLELINNYEETKGELAAQKASLDLLKSGSRPEEIEKARRLVDTKNTELLSVTRNEQERNLLKETIDKKDAELANAKVNHERTQRLLDEGLISRNEADRNRTIYEVQQKELSEAKGKLRVLEEQTDRTQDIKRKELEHAESDLKIFLAGSRKESIEAVESQVKKLEEKLKIFQQELEYLQVRSPIQGVVATSYLRNRIGDYLEKGAVFCEIVSEGTMIIDMPIPEKEIADVSPGLPITLKVRGFPKRSYEAHVISIAPVAATSGSERIVVVKGELPNTDASLKAGMTGVGKILCGKRMIIELLTRRAIRWLRTEFWEYLP